MRFGKRIDRLPIKDALSTRAQSQMIVKVEKYMKGFVYRLSHSLMMGRFQANSTYRKYFLNIFKAIKHIFERNCRISKVKRALRLVNMVECWRKRVRAHSRRKVSYIMLKNVAIMRLSVTLKTTAFCRKLSAKSSIIFDWTWLMYVWCLFHDCRQKQYRPGSETRYFTASITNLQEINDNWCSKALKMSYLL